MTDRFRVDDPPGLQSHHRGHRILVLVAVFALVLWTPDGRLAAQESASGMASTTAADEGGGSGGETLGAQVEAAEQQFNQAAGERDRETFHGLLDQDTVFLAGELYRGRLAVEAIWQHLFDGKYDFRYQGEAVETVVADSGEFAWSIGSVRTTFQRPGLPDPDVSDGHYLHLWIPGETPGEWRLLYNTSLVVHPSLGAGRDPRSGLMTAWPELSDQVDAEVDLHWHPEVSVRATSGEVAYTFGTYRASFVPAPTGGVGVAEEEAEAGTESLGEPSVVGEDEKDGAAEPAEEADRSVSGEGYYLAVWQKDERGQWQLAGEGFTPPGIYGGN